MARICVVSTRRGKFYSPSWWLGSSEETAKPKHNKRPQWDQQVMVCAFFFIKLFKEKTPPAINLQCCVRRILSQCEDFRILVGRNCGSFGPSQLSFFSKFQRKLNFIEMLYVKAELRRMCTFSFSDLNEEAVTRAATW